MPGAGHERLGKRTRPPCGRRTRCSTRKSWKRKTSPDSTDRHAAPSCGVLSKRTGTPNADPDRSGPAVAVVVNGSAYLVDCGPGVVRRAAAAARSDHIDALQVVQTVFITHLHSDHTLDGEYVS